MKMRFPRMLKIKQRFSRHPSIDIAKLIGAKLREKEFANLIQPGQRIGLTVGSRNIAQLQQIVHCLITKIKEAGAQPYIIPAMGSHGGATDTGQTTLLNHLGIDQAALATPFLSSMEVVKLGESPSGIPVYSARAATEVDGIILFNRIKPHTAFGGSLGSGLTKMLVVGLGKRKGAEITHQYAVQHGFSEVLQELGEIILAKLPILLGIGLIEDYYHQIAQIQFFRPEEILKHEPSLLAKARQLMGKLPFPEIDLLIVDEIGKDISGSGMDTNIIGRGIRPLPTEPHIKRILVRDLTDKTGGNAFGIGLADFTTKRLLHRINFNVTLVNILTAIAPEKGKLPPVLSTDREALKAALNSLGNWEADQVKVVRIKNTLELENIWISEGFLSEIEKQKGLKIDGPLQEISFDSEGHLI
jgi:hypothetical protein